MPWRQVRCAVPPITIRSPRPARKEIDSPPSAGFIMKRRARARGARRSRSSRRTTARFPRQADRAGARMRITMAAMVGYSGTPLPKKLGIGDGSRVAVLHAPTGFSLIKGATKLTGDPFDVIVGFVKLRGELAELI